MKLSSLNYLDIMKNNSDLEFGRSIIEGVEIKICRNSPHAYKLHVHNELSLGYIIQGTTDLTLNNTTIHYEMGDGVVIPPLMTHRCAPNDISHWAYVMLFINPTYYSDVVSFPHAKKLTGNQVHKLTGFIEQLLIEKHPDTLENILIELLLEFGEKEPIEELEPNTDDSIRIIHEYILDHVNESITLDKLQKLSGLNKFTLIRNFKKQYITTPAAYHLQYKVANAKRLLSDGMNVFDVCESLGFYDQAHLIREFKKMYGISPGKYIEQLNR